MRKINSLFILLAAFMIQMNVSAQDVLVVEPGVGTLNAAITANGGNKIYQLKAGEWYQLDGIVENVDYHLQIIGEVPAAGAVPATLQTNADAGGAVFGKMFDAKGDITLKNVYFVNADLSGVLPERFMTASDSGSRVIIDNCILDPVSGNNGIVIEGGNAKVYFTNNKAIRTGHQLNPNCGHFFITDGAPYSLDTLLVENNTFVCAGTTLWAGGFNKYAQNYVKWNHNSIILQKSQIKWSIWEKDYFWTNNLMFDVQTQPWNTPWQPMPGADVSKPKPCLIYADTIPGEVLPSTRTSLVAFNLHYRNPKLYTLVDQLNVQGKADGKTHIYLMPMIWPSDSLAICRETEMYANKTAFPKWDYNNTITDVDPLFVDQNIYKHSDSLAKWTDYATQIHAMGYPSDNYPAASLWTQWHWDPDGDVSNNSTWPVFNGVYTKADLLTASSESLPLGDLNWFPTQKALWMANKAKADAHLATVPNTRIDLTVGVKNTVLNSVNVYPNPVADVLYVSGNIKSDISIITVDGRLARSVKNATSVNVSDLSNGVYIVRINQNGASSSQKILISK